MAASTCALFNYYDLLNPLVLELSIWCTLRKIHNLNNHQYFLWSWWWLNHHLVFSTSHCMLAVVDWWPQRIDDSVSSSDFL